MKPTKIQAYEQALEKIADGNESAAAVLARDTLDMFVTDHEADRLAKNTEIKNLMMNKGLLFASAQELCDALNAAGLTTTRGKEWTKSTATRVLTEVRPMIQADLMKTTDIVGEVKIAATPVVEEPIIETPAPLVQQVVQAEYDLENFLSELPS
jgi:Trp operon repressor